MPAEHVVRCGLGAGGLADHARLTAEIDGSVHSATLRIDSLTRTLVANLPASVIDLLEIAAYVYLADAVVTRGGPADQGLGANWRRHFAFDIPVREPDRWARQEVNSALEETLGFLSDDTHRFSFREHTDPAPREAYFDLGSEGGFEADEVMLFSGGLDSLGGALEETLSQRNSVALVSHRSSTKLQKVQAELVTALAELAGRERLLHVPVTLNLAKGSHRESTHRTRSFVFAAFGLATATVFGRHRVRFHENGVTSLNLPPAGQVLGARATRSTHPQALSGFSNLFSAVFDRPVRVDNPFLWRTKTQVLELIRDLGGAELIPRTRSCVHVHGMYTMHPHCGTCSQCIDRRFAMLAARLDAADPVETYEIDPLYGQPKTVQESELALGYVRNARCFAAMTPAQFVGSFGEVQRAVGFLDEPAEAVLGRLYRLHQRHGTAIAEVIDSHVKQAIAPSAPALDQNCLVVLAGHDILAPSEGHLALEPVPPSLSRREMSPEDEENWMVCVDEAAGVVTIEGLGTLKGKSAVLIAHLARINLQAAGDGLVPEDYPLKSAAELASKLDIGEEAVRRRVSRVRTDINDLRAGRGLNPLDRDSIVETAAGGGYRLNPTRVRVVRPRST